LQNQKINQPKLLQSNSRQLRRKLRRLSLRSLRLLSPSRELKVRMMISKLPLISVNPNVEAVVVAEATEVAVEAKEVAVVVTVAAVAAVAVAMASAEDTVVEAVTALSVESALSAMKTVKAVVEVVAEAEAVVEEVVEDSMAIAHKLLLWRAEMLPKVVSQNAELSVEKLVVTDPAITSTALLARLVNFKKGGFGKGNWGDETKPIVEGETPATEGATEEAKEPRRERRERKPEPVPEKVEEEEEVGFTLQDYLNQKASKTSNQLTAAQTREREAINQKGLLAKQDQKETVSTINNQLTQADLHAKAKTSDYDLLGF
jgi:hypothetical protein